MRATALIALFSLLVATVAPAQTSTPTNQSPGTAQPCNCPCANSSMGNPQGAMNSGSQTNTNTNAGQVGASASSTPSQAGASQQSPNQTGTYNDPSGSQAGSAGTTQTAPTTTYDQNSTSSAPSAQSSSNTAGAQNQTGTSTSDSPVLQSRPQSPTTVPMARTVPVGTEVQAALDRALSSKTAKDGEQFSATLTEPLRNQNGEVLVPIGAKLQGTITAESGKALPSVRGKGRLGLRFNDIQLSDGTSVPVQATLLGVHDTSGKDTGSTNEEGEVTGRTTGGQAAKNVGIGAGIGTVAGLIFGSALKGMLIGAIAGGGYVLAKGGQDVNLPAQTGLRLRLDQNVTVPAGAAKTSGAYESGTPANPQ